MKDVVISKNFITHELRIYGVCLVVALFVNAYSIIRFKTEWKELFTTLHISLAVALVFFATFALLRWILFTCGRILRRK